VFNLPALAVQAGNSARRELGCWQIGQQPYRGVTIFCGVIQVQFHPAQAQSLSRIALDLDRLFRHRAGFYPSPMPRFLQRAGSV
jgi:hypothetical protein